MSFAERPYQAKLDSEIVAQWNAGKRGVMAQLSTGGGKTVVVSNIVQRETEPSAFIAHRQELVSQASLAYARNGIEHRILGPASALQTCIAIQMAELGRSWVHPQAPAAVGGVDTLIRMDPRDSWLRSVGLAVVDEAHHVLKANKWGRGLEMFPRARFLLPTATPVRGDGKGLGTHAHGLADVLVEGPGMRQLITAGYLTDYKIFAPPTDLSLADVGVSADGDYEKSSRKKAVDRSSITGDAVEHYLRIAPGKQGVCFANDIENAEKITKAFRARGVAAELVTGTTPAILRASILRRFRAREITMMVNVDLFGEGFDLPALEVVIMARPTKSFSLYCQQFGRVLRQLEGKLWGIVIDMVGNVADFAMTRGLPDTPQIWTLDARERGAKAAKNPDAVPVRPCLNMHVGGAEVDGVMTGGVPCGATFERVLDCCPFCLAVPPPAGRASPLQVDGVLHELDPEVLRIMRGEVERVDGPAPWLPHLGDVPNRGLANRHHARQQAQQSLRTAIALWGGWQVDHLHRSPTEAQRRFFHRFGLDGMSAAALGAPDAAALESKIREHLAANAIIDATVNN